MQFNVKDRQVLQNIAASSHRNAAIKFLISFKTNSKQISVTDISTNTKKVFEVNELYPSLHMSA
jgi:hypothetical protein